MTKQEECIVTIAAEYMVKGHRNLARYERFEKVPVTDMCDQIHSMVCAVLARIDDSKRLNVMRISITEPEVLPCHAE